MPRKFQGFRECRFRGPEKDYYYLKTPKWEHKIIRKYKPGKLASYFLDNAAKSRSYKLKISENFEIKHLFQSKSFIHHSNFLYTGCLSVFNVSKRFYLRSSNKLPALQNISVYCPWKNIKKHYTSNKVNTEFGHIMIRFTD